MASNDRGNALVIAFSFAFGVLSFLTTLATGLSVWIKISCWLVTVGLVLIAIRREAQIANRAAKLDRWLRGNNKMATAAIALVFALAATSVVVGFIGKLDTSAHAKHTTPTSVLKLRSSLAVRDLTTKGSDWGTRTSAYGADDLAFDAVVENRSDKATSPVVVQLVMPQQQGGGPLAVELVAGAAGNSPATHASVHVAQRSCFSDLTTGAVRMVNAAGAVMGGAPPAERALANLGDNGPVEGLGDALIGRIDPHSQSRLRFFVQVDVGEVRFTLDSGPNVSVSRNGQPYSTTLTAEPGDRLRAGVLLFTGDCTRQIQSFPVRVRFSVKKQIGSDSYLLTAIAGPALSPSLGKPITVGKAVIGVPEIRQTTLSVVPGTTRVYANKPGTGCKATFSRALPAGIDAGGVLVKGMYGYRPHDPCTGAELAHYVEFDLALNTR